MRQVLVLAALLGVVGCEEGPAATPTPSVSPAPDPAIGTGCVASEAGPVNAGSVLVPGPVNGVPSSHAGGERLTLAATVLGPDCRPAAGADVRLWHTDAKGLYAPSGSPNECCFFGGTVTTDQNGRFRLDTIRPGKYPEANGPLAHIHFEIRHPSGRLDTEIVFDEGAPTAGPVAPSDVLRVALRSSGGGWAGAATFVLEP